MIPSTGCERVVSSSATSECPIRNVMRSGSILMIIVLAALALVLPRFSHEEEGDSAKGRFSSERCNKLYQQQ